MLLSSATVREAITTSALLKLPRSMPMTEKVARVDGILKELVRAESRAGTALHALLGVRSSLEEQTGSHDRLCVKGRLGRAV